MYFAQPSFSLFEWCVVHTRKSKDNKQNILIVPQLNLVLKAQLKLGFVDTLGHRRLDASLKIFIMSVFGWIGF